jgi:hypothetical protein
MAEAPTTGSGFRHRSLSAKGGSARNTYVPDTVLRDLHGYIEIDRAQVRPFAERRWRRRSWWLGVGSRSLVMCLRTLRVAAMQALWKGSQGQARA